MDWMCIFWIGKMLVWVYANFIVHSGARQDDVNKEGTAHFVEHLVSENISVTSGDLCAFFKECGGTVNLGMTDYLFTEYGFFTPADQDVVKQGFGYMGEIFANNILLQNRIERERNVIIAEILEDHSFSIAAENFLQHKKRSCRDLFLSRFLSVAGSCNSVNNIIQKDLQSYYDTYYVASNMSIVLVGNVSWYDVEHLLSVSGFLNNVKGHKKQLPVGTSDLQKLSAVSDVFFWSKFEL